jgi:hypothetical protein
MENVDWQGALSVMQRQPPSLRTYESPAGDTFIGEVVSYSGVLHLVVGRIGAGFMQTVDLDHGHIEDLRLEGNRGFVDTSTICFLDYGNIIGIMRGNMSAPQATAIANWINGCSLVMEELALWPVVSKSVWDKLQSAHAVHNFEFAFRPNPAYMPQDGTSIFGFTREMGRRYSDHRVTFKVEVTKRGGGSAISRARGQRQLQDDAERLMSEIGYMVGPNGLERARALVTTTTNDGSLAEESLDFLKHHITAKKRVEIRDEDSRPRSVAAVQAILGAAREHADELRAAVSA